MSIGNSQQALESRRHLNPGDVEISERAFNLIIGGVLAWGFLLNYIMVEFFGDRIAYWTAGMNPLIYLIAYIVLVLIGSSLIAQPNPVTSFIGYNLIAVPVGVMLCGVLTGISHSVIKTSVLLTTIMTLSFMIASLLFPGFFSSLGRVLLFSLLCTILGEVITALFFRGSAVYEWIYAGIFSLYIGYDWARANTCARTVDNAVDLSATLYLDIVNLFLRIVRIVSRNNRRD